MSPVFYITPHDMLVPDDEDLVDVILEEFPGATFHENRVECRVRIPHPNGTTYEISARGFGAGYRIARRMALQRAVEFCHTGPTGDEEPIA